MSILSHANWKKMAKRFSRIRVLVIGDVMLDQYLIGRVNRISPDAPVPIVDVQTEKYFPGGASNVARNLRSLTAQVAVFGLIGNDDAGVRLTKELKDHGIETQLLQDPTRPTTLKTRVMAQRQQVVRYDRESRQPMSASLRQKALKYVKRLIEKVDAVVFEDYGKGVIEQEFLDDCMELARKANVLTFADPNAHHHLSYRGLVGITPNRSEAFWMAKEPPQDPHPDPLKDPHLLQVGNKLLLETETENVLITLGEHGICLFRDGHKPFHVPTSAPEVFDASGAGDTAISAFTLGLCAGVDPIAAAYLSNQAAGIVVGKAGIATVTPDELLKVL